MLAQPAAARRVRFAPQPAARISRPRPDGLPALPRLPPLGLPVGGGRPPPTGLSAAARPHSVRPPRLPWGHLLARAGLLAAVVAGSYVGLSTTTTVPLILPPNYLVETFLVGLGLSAFSGFEYPKYRWVEPAYLLVRAVCLGASGNGFLLLPVPVLLACAVGTTLLWACALREPVPAEALTLWRPGSEQSGFDRCKFAALVGAEIWLASQDAVALPLLPLFGACAGAALLGSLWIRAPYTRLELQGGRRPNLPASGRVDGLRHASLMWLEMLSLTTTLAASLLPV
jgi:hypothetical protein